MKVIGQPVALNVKEVTGQIHSLNDLLSAYLKLKAIRRELRRREHPTEHELADSVSGALSASQRTLTTLVKHFQASMENMSNYQKFISTNGNDTINPGTENVLCDEDIIRLVGIHSASVNWELTPDGACSTEEEPKLLLQARSRLTPWKGGKPS